MDVLPTYFAMAITVSLSAFCWWHVSRSDHAAIVKIVLVLIAAVPVLGPLLYLFVHTPPRTSRPLPDINSRTGKPSALLRQFNEREHVYLAWASAVFWILAIVAYWLNHWTPGHIIDGPWGSFTQVDAIFFSLLVVAILTFGAALRAKVIFDRRLKEASNYLLQATGQKRPAPE